LKNYKAFFLVGETNFRFL